MKSMILFVAGVVLAAALLTYGLIIYDHMRSCRIDPYAESFAWKCQ